MMPESRRLPQSQLEAHRTCGPLLRLTVVLAACCVVLACEPGLEEVELPSEMIGRWVTRTPSHAQTYFELAPEKLTFGTLEGPEEYAIYRIRVDRKPHVPKYTIEYHTVEGVSPFTFWYQPRHNVIRWDHRWNMIWQLETAEPLVRDKADDEPPRQSRSLLPLIRAPLPSAGAQRS